MKKINPSKALAGLIDWGVFLLASIMLFLKTSEVMTRFAPSEILGFTNIGPIYGMASALLVEGTLILAKISTRYSENGAAWLWNVGLIVLTWLISAGAQIVDGVLVADKLDTLPYVVVFLVRVGVPMIPSIVLAAVLIKNVMATLPADEPASKPKPAPKAEPKAESRSEIQPSTRPVYASETDGHPNLKQGGK